MLAAMSAIFLRSFIACVRKNSYACASVHPLISQRIAFAWSIHLRPSSRSISCSRSASQFARSRWMQAAQRTANRRVSALAPNGTTPSTSEASVSGNGCSVSRQIQMSGMLRRLRTWDAQCGMRAAGAATMTASAAPIRRSASDSEAAIRCSNRGSAGGQPSPFLMKSVSKIHTTTVTVLPAPCDF